MTKALELETPGPFLAPWKSGENGIHSIIKEMSINE
jgi:hypothetical protein